MRTTIGGGKNDRQVGAIPCDVEISNSISLTALGYGLPKNPRPNRASPWTDLSSRNLLPKKLRLLKYPTNTVVRSQ